MRLRHPLRSVSSRGVLGVRLPHQEFEIFVDVRQFGQSKVNAVPEPAERSDPMQASVLDPALQPLVSASRDVHSVCLASRFSHGALVSQIVYTMIRAPSAARAG
jgi:hypothetical protein